MALSPEYEIISSLTRPGASAETAVQKLQALTAAASVADLNGTGSNALSDHIYSTWNALVEDVVADTPPAQQGELIEFIRVLRLQKVVDTATNSPLLYNLAPGHDIPVWTGLPLFGISVRDEWNFDASSCTPAEEARYYSKLAFLAQLTGLPENTAPDTNLELLPYDFSLYALWDFRDVFEQDPSSEHARTILLRGASHWMIHCAEKLWANVQAERSFVHQASGTNPAQAGPRFSKERDWSGFNKERWTVWVEGLKNVNGVEDEDLMELISKALNETERVQRLI